MSLLRLSMKIVAPVVLVAFLATGGIAVAFTAANTTPTSKVGDGAGAASGYTVSAEVYTLNGTDPTLVDQVAFTLSATPPAGSVIKVRLVSAGIDWYSCSNTATAVTCATTSPQATAASVDQLRVVVAQ